MKEQDKLVTKAQTFIFLSRAFDYPDEKMQDALSSGSFTQTIERALQQFSNETKLKKSTRKLQDSLSEIKQNISSLEGEYTYLFYRNVSVSPNESYYVAQKHGASLSVLPDLASFYKAFGMQLSEKADALPDHVTVELEFMAFLCLKESFALEKGWAEKARISQDARRKFLKEHIGNWFPSFQENLGKKARLSFYTSLAEFTQAFLSLKEPAAHSAIREKLRS